MTCPSCGSPHVRLRGALPDSKYFAGRERAQALPGGNLYACTSCHLHFRHPRISQQALNNLYRDGSLEAWQYEPGSRIDWEIALEEAHSMHAGRVLDIGCFDGAFLDQIDDRWQKYGIEPHPQAAARASERGIEILAETFDEVDSAEAADFDLITAFDLVEHLPDPARLLGFASRSLRSGGRLVIGTGDTDARTWRLMGAQYWYCAIPEHLSFINEPWVRKAAAAHGMHVRRLERYSHQTDAGSGHRLHELAANLTHRISPRITGMLRSAGFGGLDVRSDQILKQFPPQWMSATDHLLAVLQK